MSLEFKCLMFDIANGHQTLLQNKNYYIKKTTTFMFVVMLVIGMLQEVWQLSYTSSNFALMITIVMLVA
jgi:hypothetical protein